MTTSDVYHRGADLREFDGTKAGVKGLVDSGITSLPRIFRVGPEDEPTIGLPTAPGDGSLQIPVIDLARDPVKSVVEAVRRAAGEWGFFQVVGHGVPESVMEGVLQGGRRFHEETQGAEKAAMYTRDGGKKVVFVSNYKLFTARFAEWHDTLNCRMAPQAPEPEEIPSVCRDAAIQYSAHMAHLGDTLLELLSQALGLPPNRLKEMECNKGQTVLFQYYPPCPDPESALGARSHSDPNFLTVLLQDQVGGLQVLHHGQWVDVKPTAGALVVNIGDLLQIMSNDKFISVEHRVRVKKYVARMSVACFLVNYTPPFPTAPYGPLHELLSEENPPVYRQFSLQDYVYSIIANGHLRGKAFVNTFKL